MIFFHHHRISTYLIFIVLYIDIYFIRKYVLGFLKIIIIIQN